MSVVDYLGASRVIEKVMHGSEGGSRKRSDAYGDGLSPRRKRREHGSRAYRNLIATAPRPDPYC